MNRRDLLRSALATAVAGFSHALAMQASAAGTRRMPLSSCPFALGVACGEPTSDGCVIWTRLVGLDLPAVEVSYEIAADDGFRHIVQKGRVTAVASFGHAVHVAVKGLRPGATYWYRFHCGDAVSRVGRFRTIALAPQRLRVALASCQHWEQGFFSAYDDMLDRDVDVVLHVGDYIYESSLAGASVLRTFGAAPPQTLTDYRARYALYRQDEHLQRAHAALPFIVTWDDHEVQNDYAGESSALGMEALRFRNLRTAAYQAWLEHMPLHPASVRRDGDDIRIFRRLTWPRLATFHVLDTRQYRHAQPCSPPLQRRGARIARCPELDDPARSILGGAQERWLNSGLTTQSTTWNVLAQQTLFAPMRLPGDTLWSDFWDAYPASRQRVIDTLRQGPVRNPLVLGGDLHSFWANDVHAVPENPQSPVIATEILTTCLAAKNGPAELFAQVPALNPQVRFLDYSHSGYALLDIAPDAVDVDLRMVERLQDPRSPLSSLRSFVIEAARPGAVAR